MTEHFISEWSCIIYVHRGSHPHLSALEMLLTQKAFLGKAKQIDCIQFIESTDSAFYLVTHFNIQKLIFTPACENLS